jgi:hypothetical protein
VVGQDSLATGVIFEWCDGYRSSIADALLRSVQWQVEIRPLALQSLEGGRARCGELGETFEEILDNLGSQSGALRINHQTYCSIP